MTVEHKIRAIMKATGRKQQELARHFGVSQSTVHRWLTGSDPEGRHHEAINELYEQIVGVPEMEDGRPATVPLVGYVGAGAVAHYYATTDGPIEQVAAPEDATTNTVAAEIRGDSLGSLFDSWLVYYDDVRSPVTPDLIGRLCVVGLMDDRVLVKKLQKSKTPGLFHLISNSNIDPILDVEVIWAARVKQMVPR